MPRTAAGRRTPAIRRRTLLSAAPVSSGVSRLRWEISAPRTAFISASSKVRPMAMTSPVAFIWVPSVRLA